MPRFGIVFLHSFPNFEFISGFWVDVESTVNGACVIKGGCWRYNDLSEIVGDKVSEAWIEGWERCDGSWKVKMRVYTCIRGCLAGISTIFSPLLLGI